MSVLRQCGALLARHMLTAPQRKVALNAALLGGRSELQPKVVCIDVRSYKKFGHEHEKIPRMTYVFHFCVGTLFLITIMDWQKVKKMLMPKVDADAGREDPEISLTKGKRRAKAGTSTDDGEGEDDQIDEMDKTQKKEKDKMGFRERKILEYENRIRQFSTPDKVFRYFATVRVTTSAGPAIYMTPDDFLRSICPGVRQPDGLGLDQYRRYDPKSVTDNLDLNLEKGSIFYKLGSYGLITFSDYIFLLTVLSTSRRHFEIAFQMFDLNGDGDVDSEEFEKVATLVRQQSSMGSRHRDHSNTGNMFKSKGVNSALTVYFFGKDLKQKLTIEKFLNFQTQLQCEILSLEFERKHPNEKGLISELDFAELLLAYAGYPHKIKARKLKRVKRRFKDEASKGISKQDYLDFFHFLNNINDVDTALTFYHIAGASIDQATLRHVARTVAKRDLSQHVVDVVFTIFDEDNDNQLSNTEFVAVMKNRIHRGLEKPKDTGFVRLMRSMLKCAKETKPVLLDL